jgi:hypothetical protein
MIQDVLAKVHEIQSAQPDESLCCVPDETPMGITLSVGQELFGGESISTEGDEKRNETNQTVALVAAAAER